MWSRGQTGRRDSGGAIANALLVLLALLVALGAAMYFYGPQLMLYFLYRTSWGDSPELFLTPETITLPPPAKSRSQPVSYYGFSFELPWKTIKEERVGDFDTALDFESGLRLSVLDPSREMRSYYTWARQMRAEQGVSAAFTPAELASAFDFYLRAVRRTPAEVSMRISRMDAMRLMTQLSMKRTIVMRGISRLYVMETESLKALQAGQPGRDPMVSLHLFPDSETVLTMWIFSFADQTSPVSQDDLNRIIYSLRRAPDTPPARPSPPR